MSNYQTNQHKLTKFELTEHETEILINSIELSQYANDYTKDWLFDMKKILSNKELISITDIALLMANSNLDDHNKDTYKLKVGILHFD